MAQEDLMERLRKYSSYLDRQIKGMENLAADAQSLFILDIVGREKENYTKARDKLYELIPELKPEQKRK